MWVYTLGVKFYHWLIILAQPFSSKARDWVRGRRSQVAELAVFDFNSPIWIHCASLGEFEQGRPIIELIKEKYPTQQVVLSFYSPSGYSVRKDYPLVDLVCYMPLDTPTRARHFTELLKPRLAIMVKYDFWFNHLRALSDHGTPFIYVSLHLRPGHFLLKSGFRRLFEVLAQAKHLFTQDSTSQILLEDRHVSDVSTVGDTRIDRVLSLNKGEKTFSFLDDLIEGRKVFIFGSVWPADMVHIAPFLNAHHQNNKYLFILASHEVDKKSLERVDGYLISSAHRFSELPSKIKLESNVISVDTMGDLAHLYHYGDIAYVGGGFGRGLHSILEPAAAGLPIIFGPNYKKFREAVDLVEMGAAYSIESARRLTETIELLQDAQVYRDAQGLLSQYLETNRGASSKIVSYLSAHNLAG